MKPYLYELVNRVPPITDEDLAAMRRIEPVLKADGVMYRRIIGADKIDPVNVSFLWDAQPTGELFSFHILNITTIITQHHSSVFFKPSLAEVYAWIRVFMPDTWGNVKFFCMGDVFRIGSSTDYACHCEVMGGDLLIRGREVRMATGAVGYELVKK